MGYFEAFLFGLVQGITEYLPVSSSAHLILLPRFLGTTDPGLTFDVFLHVGTLFATLAYFWRDWLGILRDPKGLFKFDGEGVTLGVLAVATLPALIFGAALHGFIETSLRANAVLVCSLSLGGLLLYVVDAKARQDRAFETIRLRDALWVGLFQCLALIPGVSRSGSTMIGGRARGLDRAAAARFSFLLSAPVTGAAVVFEMRHWRQLVEGVGDIGPLLVAGGSSFVFGMLAIGGLLRVVKRFGYLSFAAYRVALAVVIALYLGL